MTTNRPALALLDAAEDATPGVAWEEVPCPLCGHPSGTPLLEAPDPLPAKGLIFAVVRCVHCGLAYTNPRPTERTISRFYPADYRPHHRTGRGRPARRVSPFLSRLLGRPCGERRGQLPWPGAGRLLDFGCGGGSFLKTMAVRGWEVTGLDASESAVQHVRDRLGLNALVGTLPHADLRPGSFDVVTMWHSLEHVHRPLAVLREAHRLLVPGGKLIVATPNIRSLPYCAFGSSWFGLDLPRHLTHFSPETLREMLDTAGFRSGPVRQMRHSDWLRSSAKLALRNGTGGLLSCALYWKPVAKFAAWACYAAGQADCILCVAERPA
jgi:2-polyprenyl-3-methyl-5-hydroxy-6-metoxy-1,4-benzoquinol methylase